MRAVIIHRSRSAIPALLGTTALVLSLALVAPAWANGGLGRGLFSDAPGGADQATTAGGEGSSGLSESSGWIVTGGGGGGAGVTGGAGGAGYANGQSGAGGAGGATAGASGSDGADASTSGHYGGGGGGGGGAHGAVVTSSGSLSSATGGNGGNGGRGGDGTTYGWGGGGGGGAGGYGTVVDGSSLAITNSSVITGGNGGRGGDGGGMAGAVVDPTVIGSDSAGTGGDGGSGGVGLSVTGASNVLINSGTIRGGNGGGGGNNYGGWFGDYAGSGGVGGAGLVGSNATIVNTGTIAGGNGGLPGDGNTAMSYFGAGGAGISGSDLTVITSGTISGGLSGLGQRANAITFTGGVNSLELRAGYSINGSVYAHSAADTLVLGGADDASFDLAGIGTQYLGFGVLAKSGTGTWTVSGVNTAATNWSITGGTLQVASGATLAAASAAIGVSGGTLDLGGTTQVLNGGVTLTGGTIQNGTLSSSGTFDLQSGTVSASLAGSGGVSKSGSGTVTLSGVNSYTGGTIVSAGMLQIMGSGTLGAISNTLAVSGGTLDLGGTTQVLNGGVTLTGGTIQNGVVSSGAAFDLQAGTVSASLVGSGGVSKSGSGAVTLSGVNSYTGGTQLQGGTIVVGNDSALGSGALAMAAGTTLAFAGTGNYTLANAIALSGMGNFAPAAGTTQTLSGAISDGGALGMLAMVGSGTLVLSGVNSYSGGTVVSGGTLRLSGSGTLGAASGALAVFGGTLDLGGTAQTQNGGVTLSGGEISNGRLSSSATFDLQSGTISAALSGNGAVSKTGSGTVTLSGANDYIGGTTISAGTLQIAGSGTLGDDNNGLTMTGGTLDLGGTTQVQNGGVTMAAGAIRNGTLASADAFNLESGTISATLAGAADLAKTSRGRVILSGVNSYTGRTLIEGGTLQVDGSIASSSLTTIDSGGTLSGIGTVGNVLVNAGGTFAPGSSMPGTSMTVAGNLAFQSGATYLVQINPATASYATVTGTATLGGGTVAASFANGSYIEKRYTILTASGGVSGTFASNVANTNLPASFKTALSYDASNVYLDLSLNFVAPSGTGFTGNQQAVGSTIVNYFNRNGGIPLVFGGLTGAGLSQLSGQSSAGAQTTSIGAMGQFAGTLMDPTSAGRMGSSGGQGALSYADETPSRKGDARDAMASIAKAPPSPTFAQRWAVWASGFGGGQSTDGNAVAGSSNTTSRIYGTAVGLDYQLTPNTIAGFALAGGGTNFNTGTLGSGRSDLFQAGAFVRHNIGPAYLSAALAYGWQDVTTERTLTVSGVDRLQAKFKTNTWSGRLEGGTRIAVPWLGGFGATPYAAAQFTRLDLPAYAEQVLSGSSTFALSYDAQKVTNTRSELGLRSDKSFALADGIFTLRGRAAWAHDFNPNRTVAATFQSLPGASFVVNGAGQAKDAALTTVSAEMAWLNGWSTAATFDGEFSSVTRSYMGKGSVRYAW